jgi:hypothetical protein
MLSLVRRSSNQLLVTVMRVRLGRHLVGWMAAFSQQVFRNRHNPSAAAMKIFSHTKGLGDARIVQQPATVTLISSTMLQEAAHAGRFSEAKS